MGKVYGRRRRRGQPRRDDYDLQLMLHVDIGTAMTGMSVNAFAKKNPLRFADGTKLDKSSLHRRYYERRILMQPVVWPDGRSEEGPIAKAYSRLLQETLTTIRGG